VQSAGVAALPIVGLLSFLLGIVVAYQGADQLRRFGADIRLDGNLAVIRGVPTLGGAPVMATDIRASSGLILAAMAAQGRTEILRVYHIDRGYQRIESKLNALGARIERVSQ